MTDKPSVLFVCVHNAGRSQMAAAWFGALADPAQGLAQIAAAADKRDFELVLVDVILFVSGGQDFAFVDVINNQ